MVDIFIFFLFRDWNISALCVGTSRSIHPRLGFVGYADNGDIKNHNSARKRLLLTILVTISAARTIL
jgi:hypothetical protein